MELVAIYDENQKLIGKCPKEEVHKKGYWHKVFSCLFIDSEKNTVYLQYKNNKHNDLSNKNKADISVGGHLVYGEEKEQGIREIKEETSLNISYESLDFVGTRIANAKINDNYIIREFIYLHILDQHFDLKTLKSIDDEALYYIEFDIDKLYKFVTTNQKSITGLTPNGKKVFSKENFITAYLEETRFYQKYLIIAKDKINGKHTTWEELK